MARDNGWTPPQKEDSEAEYLDEYAD